MKKIFGITGAALCMLFVSSCSGSSKADGNADSARAEEGKGEKVLVAYYSATGTTAKAAKEVADATGGTLYEITPVEPYTEADLDYENKESRSAKENADPSLRPEIKKGLDISGYDTVYLGFPVWWDKAPLVVYTFLDSYDFAGKKIIVFATSHSSGLVPSFEALKSAYPSYTMEPGQILSATSRPEFETWVKSLK